VAETRVDLLHLLEDLRDAYPGSIEETILTEIIANSLDSGATRIRVTADPASASLTVLDNGSGMPRKDLRRFHDLAASSKQRGQGIGFAGVGIKLALLACKEVVTESRRGRVHVATSWHLASRHRAPWRWVPPPGMVAERGTAVRLALNDALSPLTDRGFIEAALRRHYQALLDPGCTDMLKPHYPDAIMFEVNGALLDRKPCSAPEIAGVAIRMGRKRKPSAAGYLFRETASLGEDERGVAVSTYGKVIKRGWDWLGVSPAAPERIGGLIEFPALAAALTLNKGDFIRTGPRGALYLAARKAIQEAVTLQLAAWGDSREEAEVPRPRAMRSLERDLERVLLELSEGFPLLASLVEQRRGGQKRLALTPSPDLGCGAGPGAATAAETPEPPSESIPESEPTAAEPPQQEAQPPSPPPGDDSHAPPDGVGLPEPKAKPRPIRLGLAVQFEDRPGDTELGRLVESTIFVNRAHPAYQRAMASRSEGYHIALSVALALAPLAVEPANEHGFVTAFLARWGEAVTGPRGRRGKSGIGQTSRLI
jgi:hypothetical protein